MLFTPTGFVLVTGLLRLEHIVELLHEKDGYETRLEVDIRHVANPNDAYEVLRQMDTVDFAPEQEKHIILDFSSDRITQGILRQVLVASYSHLYLFSLPLFISNLFLNMKFIFEMKFYAR